MAEEKGISNILEAVQSIAVLAQIGVLVMADGKVDLKDLTHLKLLIEKREILLAGAKDIKECLPEGKDIDGAEAIVIVQALVEGFRQAKAA